jgi:lipopolysaccharide heptosyltransferase II
MTGWESARNVLCIRLDAMGDVLMTTPAFQALRHSVPHRRLTLLTSRSGAEAARLTPAIEEVIAYEAPWMKSAPDGQTGAHDLAMAQRLGDGHFDAAVIFTVYTQSALPAAFLCLLADIPLRLAHCRENPYRLLTDWVKEPEPETCIRHEVRRQLDLVASIGCASPDDRMTIAIGPRASERVDRLLSRRIDRSKRWIVLHPGGTAPSRRYPLDSFASVARQLVGSHECQILWTGSKEEEAMIGEAQKAMEEPSVSLAGQLSVEELAAVIAKAPLLISNNTSAVHLASAAGTPVVDLYALTNPQHTPWRVPNRVLFEDVPCRFCYKSLCPEGHHRCLRGVSPGAVVDAALDLLKETRAADVASRVTGKDNLSTSGQFAGSCRRAHWITG